MSAVIVIVATGDGPPACPLETILFGMSTTTTASGSLKSKATTSPVSTRFGPISGSSNALSKMPPMYLLTSSELLNPIVPSLFPRRPENLFLIKKYTTYDRRHSQQSGVCLNLVTLGQRVRLNDLIDDQLGRFGASSGAAVRILLDGVANIPQPGERGIAWQVEAGEGSLGRASLTCECGVGGYLR